MVYDFDIELAWSDLLFYMTYFCNFLWSAHLCLQKLHSNIVILYSIMIISWHICIFSYSFSWFTLKMRHHIGRFGWEIVNEWGVTPSFITAWAEWSVSLVSLSTTSLQTMTLCPSDPLPIKCSFVVFTHSWSIFLSFSGTSFSSVWPEQHARSSHDTLRGLFGRTQDEKKRAWGCRDKETSGCVNALRLNVSVTVWPHTCDPVHNECVYVCVCVCVCVCVWECGVCVCVCVWVFTWECVCEVTACSYFSCIRLLLTKVIETMSFSKANL